MGFETFQIYNSEIIINALKTGYRCLDLVENNSNLPMIKTALENAFFCSVQDGGLGLFRECLCLTIKEAK